MKSLNMIPMRAPWAYEMAKDMLANFWTPFEIEMGKDRQDILEMSKEETHVFKNALAYLTTSDIQIGDNVECGIEPALTKLGFHEPEIRIVTGIQTEQERRHSMSYQHVLESILSLDEDEQKEIYQLWENNPTMKAKVVYANDVTDELARTDSIPDTLALLWVYYCLYEGAWFMGGFNPLFALSLNGRIRGTVEQLRYIRNDETTHIDFGKRLIMEGLNRFPDVHERFMLRIEIEARNFEELEKHWAYDLLSDPFLSYSYSTHMRHYMHLVNTRFTHFAHLPYYESVVKSPLNWLSNFELRPEENFFERRVTQYRKIPGDFWSDK